MVSINLFMLAVALAVEMLAGYPDALYRVLRHPVMWIGALIGACDRWLNREDTPREARFVAGVITVIMVTALTGFVAAIVEAVLFGWPLGPVLVALVASAFLASNSLETHVRAVAEALESGGIEAGRRAVSHIVGRDPTRLDEAGVARAAVESLAENYSDGVVAPGFWLGLLGLPGIAMYKAINTADSMIGHRTKRHEAFGWAAARLDDVVNWPAARLSMLFLVAAAAILPGADPRAAFRAAMRDAKRHRSPNAGWPEAAMAGALGFRLNGPKVYAGVPTQDAYMGDGRADLGPADIRRALDLYRLANIIQLIVVLLLIAAGIALRDRPVLPSATLARTPPISAPIGDGSPGQPAELTPYIVIERYRLDETTTEEPDRPRSTTPRPGYSLSVTRIDGQQAEEEAPP